MHFTNETAVTATEPGCWTTEIGDRWSINGNPNGGYLIAPTLRAMGQLVDHPDPVTVTTYFFRPGLENCPADITADVINVSRRYSAVRARLQQEGKTRLECSAIFGDLSEATAEPPVTTLPPPDLPHPDNCAPRSALNQGVDLAFADRVEVRLPTDTAVGPDAEPEVAGWVRFIDDEPFTVWALPLIADAFPPPLFVQRGPVGWVPTIELTVQIRSRPAPGWGRARFRTEDHQGDQLIETGEVWDSTGPLVAQSRQLALLLS